MLHSVGIIPSLFTVARYDSGGKTFSLLALFILLSRFYPGSRWAIVRKDLPTIKKNLYPSWNKIKPSNFIKSHNNETHTVTFNNGSQIIFWPESHSTDKDKDRWKGLEVNGFGFEEINECQESSLQKAFERAGSYIIPNIKHQPRPIVVATCNPTQGWLKDLVYTPFKDGTLKSTWLYIQSRIYDNIPLLTAQPHYLESLKDNLNRYEYDVFVEGNWEVQLKTGGEFLRGFDLVKHIRPVKYEPSTTIHISIDSNVYPYIAVSVWQLMKGEYWIARQIEELQAADPENTASGAGKKLSRWLQSMNYTGAVYLYGDKSTKSRNNIDDNKRSFFQIFTEQITKAKFRIVDNMPSSMPPVASVSDFVNSVFNDEIKNIRIEIGENCKTSINDYIETKADKDGSILKARVKHPTIEGLTYEPHGHLTDNLKDFISQAFAVEFKKYISGKKSILQTGYFR